ncbi:interleukin-1 receptor-associated kinase 4-like isoform X1 [Macrosteles quadrilineatus]|uniref:interleukin-1 receptor-associated kinase 4-like isoform X1 n=1 Tax=Macrosteles quadrilineatus TaxID=74068 RepID=UPI0023E120CB|nr:interleukin-1 receptor-associated kinase 4-like isoform X1 [Macrosteles quadrilineatus]XP_054289166.1 interleukin-1 receptor-associated kinase 4-like isoform X1 [Macrosteles quadrilineatus]
MTKVSNEDVEIRKLPAGSTFKLCQILESGDGWRQLMAAIPISCQEGNPPKYTVEHMKLIENAGMCQKRPFSEILLEEWSTSGKCRPTVSVLLQCLLKAELYRAADYVAVELLKVPPPPRPHTGPAATITAGGVDFTPSAPPAPSSPLPTTSEHTADPAELLVSHVKEMTKLPYAQLEEVTDGFAATRLLGGGAWGQVYQATLPRLGPVAIKRLHLAVTGGPWEPLQQFHNEIDVLAQLSHPNLLPLLGYSEDGPALCLAYKYMRHGSLLDRLACTNGRQPLQWCDRLVIGLGSARGLCHLHTVLERPLVHRDVKSANILLDDNFVPKLGDFGLVRMGSNANHTQTAAITTNVIGTSAYMAPEAYRGDVSVKMDVFSFGVVLLELLTGLPPYDENREGHDLITHVDDADNRNELVDNRAGNWPQHVVQQMFELSDLCLYEKKRRPLMPAVIEKLEPLIC